MTDMNLEQARFNMIEQQIRPWEVLDQHVLDLLMDVPREDFVPEAYRNLAFADIAIPLEHDQAMLPPKIEARLLQAVDVKSDDDILEIGTGSGYLAALLGRLGGHVTSLDIHEDLQKSAAEKLAEHGITNVSMECRDAINVKPTTGQYDVIVFTGSMPILVEDYKLALKNGGRMFVFLGEAPIMEAELITRINDNEWAHEDLFETEVMQLENCPQPDHFSL